MPRPFLSALPALLLLAVACSSTGLVRATDAGTDAGGNPDTCFESSAPNQGCIDCVKAMCPSQLAAAESGCTDLFACECPGGYYVPGLAPSCAAKAQEASCTSPASAFGQCEAQSCGSECTTASGSSSGG
jgi:hypothetical protein